MANTALQKTSGDFQIIGMSAFRTADSQRNINQFTLVDRSVGHFVMLAMTITVAIFSLVTFLVCLGTPILKRTWLWAIGTLTGLGAVSFNWTTGAFAFKVLNLQILGAGVSSAGPAAPWILVASLPIGALYFWYRRKSLILNHQLNQVSEASRRIDDEGKKVFDSADTADRTSSF